MLKEVYSQDQAHGLRHRVGHCRTKVLAVSAGKGGVGKTTISVNLAIALSQLSYKTLLFDADLSLANVDVMLGLNPSIDLSHVMDDHCELSDVIIDGPEGIKIVPASSGIEGFSNLDKRAYAGIIDGFSNVMDGVDNLIIDTAAGISDAVVTFAGCADDLIVVVCDEPTSMTDAYALIKVISQSRSDVKVHVLANMVEHPTHGRALFNRLMKVSERFLDVNLHYLGALSYDSLVQRSVKKQQPFICLYPNSLASRELKRIAHKVSQWQPNNKASAKKTFFNEKTISYG